MNVEQVADIIDQNDPAWGGVGKRVVSKSSREVIERNGLAWRVEKRQAYILDHNGNPVPVDGQYATVRGDTEYPLGIVGERYRIFQNAEAFAFMDTLAQEADLTYERAMSIKNGQKILLMARMPEFATPVENDPILPYVVLSTSHDGSGSVDIMPTWVRAWCANQMPLIRRENAEAIARGDKNVWRVTLRHTQSLGAKLDAARQLIAGIHAGLAEFSQGAALLAERKFSPDASKRYIETLFPTPSEADGATQKALTIHQRRIESVREAFRHPSNQLPEMRGTWWQLMNAVTYIVDHNSRTRGRNDAQRAENRFLSVLDGNGAELKQRAMSLALEMSA